MRIFPKYYVHFIINIMRILFNILCAFYWNVMRILLECYAYNITRHTRVL
jgi:hypothetical protein